MLNKTIFVFGLWIFLRLHTHLVFCATSCQTAKGQAGHCSRLADCSAIVRGVFFPSMLNDAQCRSAEIDDAVCCADTTSTRGVFQDSVANEVDAAAKLPPQPSSNSQQTLLGNNIHIDFERSLNPAGVEVLLRQECGKAATTRIANGEDAVLNEFPWMALLRYNEKFLCGGSLITDRWVLTAAHCIKPSLTAVRLGEHDVSQVDDCKRINRKKKRCWQAQEFGIERKIRHPNYSVNGYVKDIALLQLKESVTFAENIKPICLPTRMQHLSLPLLNAIISLDQYRAEHTGNSDGVPITAGWGTTETGLTSNILQKTHLFGLSDALCLRVYSRRFVDNTKMCVGIASNASTCQGDSGGPLFYHAHYTTTSSGSDIYRHVQVGLTSLGLMRCGRSVGTPTLFENVAVSMDWITAIIAA